MFIQQEEKCPKFKAIFIDESQDLSPIQWKMFDILKNKTDDIYLAGDDDQAIYAWAGADVDRFIDEPADDEQVLEQSRRIPKAVQELSEIVLNRIEGKRKNKKYLPRDEEGSVEKIFNLDQIDLHTGNWLILSRTGSRLIEIMDLLREKGIYYQTKKGKSFKVNLYKSVLNYEKSKDCPLTDAELSDIKEYTGKDIINHDIPWYEAFEKAPQNEIQYIRLMLSNKEKLSLEPRVRLSTIHAAKGGEEDNVILILDNARKIRRAVQDSPNKRDEEHRVWYVAITRAKQKLYLHRAKIERNGYQL
jgi:DNA helicase II / ATP-dependent DNA helicase PcrA